MIFSGESVLALVFSFGPKSPFGVLVIPICDRLGSDQLKKETFFVAVDSLQNIVKLSEEKCDDSDVIPGIIIISEKENHYFITFGNFICPANIDRVKQKLDQANNLTNDQLINNDVFKDYDKLGNAIMHLRKNSEKQIDYNFFEVDENNYFFLIQTVVLIS